MINFTHADKLQERLSHCRTTEDTMISQEDINDLRSAQQAITKLERGEPLVPNSEEHKAITWAVIRLTDELLMSKRPLAEAEIDCGKTMMEKIAALDNTNNDDLLGYPKWKDE